jgi:hypothetical protein
MNIAKPMAWANTAPSGFTVGEPYEDVEKSRWRSHFVGRRRGDRCAAPLKEGASGKKEPAEAGQ